MRELPIDCSKYCPFETKVNREPKLGNGFFCPVEWMPFQARLLYTKLLESCDLNNDNGCRGSPYRTSTTRECGVDSAVQNCVNGEATPRRIPVDLKRLT